MSMSHPPMPCFAAGWATLTHHRFVLNGLRHANEILGEKAFVEEEWRVIGEYVFDGEGGRHQAFYAPLHETTVLGEVVRPHERIKVEQSLKFSPAEAQKLWSLAGLTETDQWRHDNEYGRQLFLPSPELSHWCGGFPFQQSDGAFEPLPPRLCDTRDQSYE